MWSPGVKLKSERSCESLFRPLQSSLVIPNQGATNSCNSMMMKPKKPAWGAAEYQITKKDCETLIYTIEIHTWFKRISIRCHVFVHLIFLSSLVGRDIPFPQLRRTFENKARRLRLLHLFLLAQVRPQRRRTTTQTRSSQNFLILLLAATETGLNPV